MSACDGPVFDSYEAAVAFLTAAIDYEKTVRFKYDSATFDLGRVEDLMAAVGSPHRGLSCLHVAGTKGKGSVCHMLAAVLAACGLKTGLFTSPHLVNLEERIRINGMKISRDDMRKRISELAPFVSRKRREDMASSPTYFEMLTAAAFRHFRCAGVDAAVVEVGLGGRLDSTNVVSPAVCGITTIEFDHTDKLGKTLAAIAREKAGIIKPGVPVVSAPQNPEAMDVIRRKARECCAPLWVVGQDIEITDIGGSFSVHTPLGRWDGLNPGCGGAHQRINCAVALGMLDLYSSASGRAPDKEAARRALENLVVPGRIQTVARNPLIVIDVAHTAGSMTALAQALDSRDDWRQGLFLIGFSADKDAPAMLDVLAGWRNALLRGNPPRELSFCFTRAPNPRAADPDALAQIARKCGIADCRVERAPDAALDDLLRRASPQDLVCCTGSFFLAGRIMERLGVEPA